MPSLDPTAVAANAAGIADAFRCCQINDHDGGNRLDDLSESFRGWIGIVDELVRAAEAMEAHRRSCGKIAACGCELPYVYEVWDAIAELLWNELPVDDMQGLVARAVVQSECVEEL